MAYQKHRWYTGEVVQATNLNHMEDGIESAVKSTETAQNSEIDDLFTGSSPSAAIAEKNINLGNLARYYTDEMGVINSKTAVFTGATATTPGKSGTVPQPVAGDEKKALLGDGSWGSVASDYEDLSSKPQINGVTLSGNKTLAAIGAVAASKVGASNGIAELDASGKVPSSQLPSFVDDVIDGYYSISSDKFYADALFTTEIPGESGKIYISVDTSIQYRYTGSGFSALGGALTLGETSSTAYRGDRGKTAYDDSQTNKANIGNLSNLATTHKGNLVEAINEAMTGAGITIDTAMSDISTNPVQNKVVKAVVDERQPKTLSTPIAVDGVAQTTVEGALTALNGKTVMVDSAFSSTSENPVQNKVVKAAVDKIGDVSTLATTAKTDTVAAINEVKDFVPLELTAEQLQAVKDSFSPVQAPLRKFNYSTEEQVIGSWIDGKPVYQRVYQNFNVGHGLTVLVKDFASDNNVDTLVLYNAIYKSMPASGSLQTESTYYWGTNDYMRVLVGDDGNLRCDLGSSYPSVPCTITTIVQYTKTTD